MAQHFLLTKAARTLPLARIFKMREDTAYSWFKKARWPETGGEPYCPRCGCVGAWELTRRRFKCREKTCRTEFTVTSGTIFASRNLSFRKILAVIALSVNAAKGKAALQVAREVDVDYKTAWVLLHKLREAVAAERAAMELSGTIEMDGMYIGGHVKPKNRKEDRVDRRLAENQNGRRQCVMALRQRRGRTLATVVPGEHADVAWDIVRRRVRGPAELVADEARGYDDLVGLFTMVRNNHGEAYVVEPGASTNQAESFFSRVRRAAHGVHHRFAGRYLDWYVADLAWREDMRRRDMKTQAHDLLFRALAHPVSRNIKGYWQGNKPLGVLGWDLQVA